MGSGTATASKTGNLATRLEDEPFGGRTLRVRKLRQRLVNTKPSVCLERAQIMTEVFMKTEGEPIALRKAKAFRELCSRGTIFIQDDELIVGNPASKPFAGSLSPDSYYRVLSNELETISTRAVTPYLISEDQKKLFKEFIEPYWKGKSFQDLWEARCPDDICQLTKSQAIVTEGRILGGAGSFLPNFELVTRIGINGIRKRIEAKLATLDMAMPGHYEKIVYLQALLIVAEGVLTFARRHVNLAKEMASQEKDVRRKAELEKIAGICEQVPANPARTFGEALQSLWLYHVCLWMEHDATTYGPGRMDQYLYPFYRKDIDEGRLTREEAQELLECLWVKFSGNNWLLDNAWAIYAPGYSLFQNATCGGINQDGQDAVNELSYMLLQATMDVRLHQPHITVRYNKAKNPDSFLRKAAELAALGTGHPPFYNDEVAIKYMMDWGVSLEDAWDWSSRGCDEPGLPGKTGNISSSAVQVNMGSALELALLNGVNRYVKSRLPVPETGDPRNFKTYEGFQNAFKTHLAYLIKKAAEAAQIVDVMQQEQRPILVNSLSLEECIENARDCNAGGAKYNPGAEILFSGIIDAVNSLAAVRKLVYEEKKLNWDELLTALDCDFSGYEYVRNLCLGAPKYGNDIPEVDAIATEVSQFAAQEARKYRGLFGGRRLATTVAGSAHMAAGAYVGALPSGRKAWKPVTDGISPMHGTDRTGPTAALKSAARFRTDLFSGGVLLNMRLDPAMFNTEQGMGDFIGLLRSWYDLGLFFIQFNVVSTKTLREAQMRPEEYSGLLVRVSGYSAFFVQLPKEMQDDIIARTTFGGPG